MRRLNSQTREHRAPPSNGRARTTRLLLVATPFLLALLTPATLEAQKDPEKRPAQSAPCPNITLCCHASVRGELLGPFIATLGEAGGVKPSFSWRVSAGQVAAGQGTSEIQIDTKGVKGRTLLATVEVGGYGPRCSATCIAELPGSGGPRDGRAAGGLATLSVHVKSSHESRRLSRADINFYTAGGELVGRAVTDARGRYARDGWTPGEYRVEVVADRFETQVSNVTLAAGAAGSVALTLNPTGVTPPGDPSTSPAASTSPTPGPSPTPTATPSPDPFAGPTTPTPAPAPTGRSKGLFASATEGSNWRWLLLGTVVGLVVAGYLLIVRLTEGAARAAEQAAAAGSTQQADEVHCTAYAPPSARPGDQFLVQVFAHLEEQQGELDARAAEFDPSARRFGSKKLSAAVERGRELLFSLQMRDLLIDEPSQPLVWNGDIDSVMFGVTVPEGFQPKPVIGTVTVAVVNAEGARVPVGTLKFSFQVVAADAPQAATPAPAQAQAPAPAHVSEQSYVPHKRAFISYASQNRPEVEKRVQMLLAEGIECYMDVLTFKPGERWEANIYQYIDRSDIFYLFWSEAAKGSKWVKQEIDYALKKKGDNELAPPEIKPIPIEGPPIVRPPEELDHLHFNDPILYFIKAEELTRRPPAPAPAQV